MENKMKTMHKIMSGLLVAALMVWSGVTYGIISINTLLLLVILAAVIISNMKHKSDEREWQIHFLATYGSFMVTICFLLVAQTVEFIKSGHVSPIYGYILGILLVSQALFSIALRKTGN